MQLPVNKHVLIHLQDNRNKNVIQLLGNKHVRTNSMIRQWEQQQNTQDHQLARADPQYRAQQQ